MTDPEPAGETLEAARRLADRLEGALEAIVETWASAVAADPLIPTEESLSHRDFIDHVPHMVRRICETVRSGSALEGGPVRSSDAAGHGSFRWSQGYDLVEVIREIDHLDAALHDRASREAEEIGLSREDERKVLKLIAQARNEAHVATFVAYVAEREQAVRTGDRERIEDLQSAARSKDEFLAELSHELRSPVTAILGWARLLRGGRLDEATAARALETIERNSVAQKRLVDDLLDVSRIVEGRLRLDRRPFDLEAVLRAAADSLRPAAAAKGVQIDIAPAAALPPVEGDPHRITQVFSNLLSNSVKFTPRGGRVEIRLRPADGALEVEVSDTGRGISARELPRVFERYEQSEEAAGSKEELGLGLGLYIVRNIVELHGGTVRADSAGEGRGATFTVALPCRQTQSAAPHAGLPRVRPACSFSPPD